MINVPCSCLKIFLLCRPRGTRTWEVWPRPTFSSPSRLTPNKPAVSSKPNKLKHRCQEMVCKFSYLLQLFSSKNLASKEKGRLYRNSVTRFLPLFFAHKNLPRQKRFSKIFDFKVRKSRVRVINDYADILST